MLNVRNVVCVQPKEELRTTANAIVREMKTEETGDQESDPDEGEISNKED